MLDHVLAHIQSDKKATSFKNANTRHYVKNLFDIKDNIIVEHEYSFLALFKFFAITLLKTLVLTFKH